MIAVFKVRLLLLAVIVVSSISLFAAADHEEQMHQPPPAMPLQSQPVIPEHQEISGPFFEGSEVTEACLECHEESARDFMKTRHWTWSSKQYVYEKGWIDTGKKHGMNNFCYGVASNMTRCSECHAGYGWVDDSFDFDDPTNIDCLVCHDTTGTYRRIGGGDGGLADPATDFERVARNVGKPSRYNCGQCHFYGGAGHGVKHGDLDKELLNTTRDIDVHMAADGLNYQCSNCHFAKNHQLMGTSMSLTPSGDLAATCRDCHKPEPHEKGALNFHIKNVSCQACHIPYYAKAQATNMSWDWSKAGEKTEYERDEQGLVLYSPTKGVYTWEKDLLPEYAWFNGLAGIHVWGEKINPDEPVKMNWPVGQKDDGTSKIYPFKVHRGRQMYDSKLNYLINPHLFGVEGLVDDFKSWERSAEIGMKARGLEFSGEYDFIDNLMYLRINHMVAPAKQALVCRDCHGKDQKRMDWQKLGYEADPFYEEGQARFPVKK